MVLRARVYDFIFLAEAKHKLYHTTLKKQTESEFNNLSYDKQEISFLMPDKLSHKNFIPSILKALPKLSHITKKTKESGYFILALDIDCCRF